MRADADEILALAVDLASQAAVVHADGRRMVLRVEEKGSPFSLVTAVDREAERVIVDGIVAARPGDEIVGEEGTSRSGSSGVRWVVDPLDGTANYVYGYAAHSVSIGVEVDDEPTVGVVFDTGRRILYSAVRGGDATANGEPISASDKADLRTALVATGFSFEPALRTKQADVLASIIGSVRDIRRSGAASIDLVALATGAVDAYYEGGLARWDVAGGLVIAEAAGATVLRSSADGYPGIGVIGANARLLERLTAMLRDAGFALDGPETPTAGVPRR
jgi:myo-inositol-1(or 4)-monophosphatase